MVLAFTKGRKVAVVLLHVLVGESESFSVTRQNNAHTMPVAQVPHPTGLQLMGLKLLSRQSLYLLSPAYLAVCLGVELFSL